MKNMTKNMLDNMYYITKYASYDKLYAKYVLKYEKYDIEYVG